MKRILTLVIISAIFLMALSSCEVTSKRRTLTIGVSEGTEGAALTETVAAIITEEDGTVLLLRLDRVTYAPTIDAYGEPVIIVPKTVSETGGHEYEEIKRLEAFAVGKTVEEIISDTELSVSHKEDYIAAIEKAHKNEYKTSFLSKNLECEVAMYLEPTANGEDMSFTLIGNFAAIAKSGRKLAGAIIDSNEVTIKVDYTDGGEHAVINTVSLGTKLEQGESYGMDDYNPYAIGEWYEQAGAYVKALGGIKLKGLETELPDSAAGCTIGTESYRAALAKAAEKFR